MAIRDTRGGQLVQHGATLEALDAQLVPNENENEPN